ncbi:MAG: glycosyltransferase [Chloroflexi bacterium]|nr:glycosyltransferase [Chloroflexota bacterium]
MISVVIPALNEEKLLPPCLESLKNQDYKGGYEIIVVDNGSTDNTGKVAREFGARVIPCPQKGVVYARQAGAYSALGDIIVQAYADTVYSKGWLTRIAGYFSTHPRSVALAGAYRYQDPPPRWARLEYFLRSSVNLIGLLFLGRPVVISGANFAFRREAFLKINGYDAHSLYPDQWGISRCLSRLGKIAYVQGLSVSTSGRRVQKPTYRLLIEVMLNLTRIMRHFVKHDINLLKTFTVKLPWVRTPARLMALLLLASIVGILAYGYAAPGAEVFGKVYHAGKTSDNIVALTFDDGPNEPYTSQVLDILNSYGIKGTFFAIGKNVELYPETARRIIADGHVLGNHTYSHKANHALMENSYKDIELAQEVIFKVTGVKPHLYRPPHGKKSPWELQFLKKEKLIEVTWSVSANDQHILAYFGEPSPEIFAKEIISKVRRGTIVLLHDGYGTNHGDIKSDKSLTVKALPIIIEELTKQGYRFVTVPELLEIPAYNN